MRRSMVRATGSLWFLEWQEMALGRKVNRNAFGSPGAG